MKRIDYFFADTQLMLDVRAGNRSGMATQYSNGLGSWLRSQAGGSHHSFSDSQTSVHTIITRRSRYGLRFRGYYPRLSMLVDLN